MSSFILFGLLPGSSFSQQPDDLIDKGNALYDEQKFGEAEMSYREGQETGADPFISGFNLGDALFKQERYEEAATAFQTLPGLTENKGRKAAALHNMGNSFLKTKKYQESVDAYKQSLRNNPHDLNTKYNLAYAMRLLQEQQQQEQDQDKKKNGDKKEDQEQKKDKQDQDEKKDEDQKQDQQQDQKQDEEKEQQPQENKISKEDAERMLDALNQDEKDIRDRLDKQRHKKGVKVKIEKDW